MTISTAPTCSISRAVRPSVAASRAARSSLVRVCSLRAADCPAFAPLAIVSVSRLARFLRELSSCFHLLSLTPLISVVYYLQAITTITITVLPMTMTR